MKKSVFRRLDEITPGATDQINVDNVIIKDGKIDDKFIDVEKHPENAFKGTTIDNLSDAYDLIWSAGVTSGGDISYDNNTNTITVKEAQGVLRDKNLSNATLFSLKIPEKTFIVGENQDLDFDTEYFISANFNSGEGNTPTFVVNKSSSLINCRDNCILYTVFVDSSTNTIITLTARGENVDGNASLRRKLFRTNRLERASNGSLVTKVSNTKRWRLSAGTIFFGLNPIDHKDFDTASGNDVFTYFFRDGNDGFNEVPNQKNIDNLKYDNGSGTLATLQDDVLPPEGTGQSYGLHWLYLILNSSSSSGGSLAVVYGTKSFSSVAQAQSESQPSELPNIINSTGILLGRAIIKRNNDEIDIIESIFRPTFIGTNAQQHNNLSGLQGGAIDLYEHSDQPINKINTPRWNRVLSQYSNNGITSGDPSLPGFSFFNDNDTGMYRSSENQLSFSTAGDEKLKITPNGKIELLSENALVVNRGPSSTRPIGENGMIRFNTSNNFLEFYINDWISISNNSNEGDFVHRFGDTMTGDLDITNNVDGVLISKDGNIKITKTSINPSAHIDFKNKNSNNFNTRIALNNNGLDFHLSNSASPKIKMDQNGNIIPGSSLNGNVGTSSNLWLNMYSRRYLANNNGGGEKVASYGFINSPNTGMYRNSNENLGFVVNGNEEVVISKNNGLVLLNNTSGIKVNNGTTSQRPDEQNGIIRYNTSDNALEIFSNTSWIQLTSEENQGTFVKRAGDSLEGGLTFSGVTTAINAGNGHIINTAFPTSDPNKINLLSAEKNRIGTLEYNDRRYVNLSGDTLKGDLSSEKDVRITLDSGITNKPSYSFKNDFSSGLYLKNNNEISLVTNETDRMIINNDGVTFTGNITVEGTSTTFNTSVLSVDDNILTINNNETGAGITKPSSKSGIEINRGTLDNISWTFDEFFNYWHPSGPAESLSLLSIGNIERINLQQASNSLNIEGSGAVLLTSGLTVERPSTLINGQIRYNVDDNALESYINNTWMQFTSQKNTGDFVHRFGDTLTGDLDLNQNILKNVSDPSNGNEVGNRNYNDNRYVLESGDTINGIINFNSDVNINNSNSKITFDPNNNTNVYSLSVENSKFILKNENLSNDLISINDNGKLELHKDQIIGINGSLNNPTYSFSNNTNSGMYYDNSSIKFSINGNETVSFSENGIIVEGNLNVKGETTTFNTNDINIEDNIIVLNKNETGNGVTLGSSGIEVDRGSGTNKRWVYNELNDWWEPNNTNKIGNINTIDTTTSGNNLRIKGKVISRDIVPDGNNSRDIGTQSLKYNNIYATNFVGQSTKALYADIAERYHSDKHYYNGMVVIFGGKKEITTTDVINDIRVAGVISSEPAHLMNCEAGNDITHPPVALLGRVPVFVKGKVKKGEMLTTSNIEGIAQKANYPILGSIIGKSLVNKISDSIELIEVAIRPS